MAATENAVDACIARVPAPDGEVLPNTREPMAVNDALPVVAATLILLVDVTIK